MLNSATELKNDLREIAMKLNPSRTRDLRWPIALGYCCSHQRRKQKIRPEILANAIGVNVDALADFEIGRICLPNDKLKAIAGELGYADAEAYLRDADKLTPEPGTVRATKSKNGKASR